LTALQTQVTTNTADLSSKTTQISVINSIQGGHTTSIGNNYNEIFRLNGISLNHTTLLTGLRTDVDSGSGGSQADITNLQNDISTINTTLTAHDGRIFTNTTDVFQLQTNGHEGRITSVEATISTLVTDVGANTTLVNNLLSGLQIFGRSITRVEADVTALRTDTDANTLSCSQLLTANQYQSTTIFAIDTAIQGLNGRVGVLETTQVTHADLIREFDQLFNEPTNGVVDKLNNIISTYNTHISGAYLTLRRNVNDNNLILGTLSTNTTSLFTGLTMLYSRVEDLETHHP
jgi:hypothetical protein